MTATIVIDSGSASTRVGLAGMTEPSVVVSTAVGTKLKSKQPCMADEMVPLVTTQDGAYRFASTHDFHYMVRNGTIQDWDALEKLWHNCLFDQLRCDPQEHNVLLTESPFATSEHREQTAEIMFETFHVPGISLASQPVLSMISSWGNLDHLRPDRLSGTVVDSGEGLTTVIPVADGHVLRNSIQQIPIGGRDITSYVQELLRANKRPISPAKSFQIARQIKETYGYVCSSLDRERIRAQEVMASGVCFGMNPWECIVDEERYLAGEVLFQPTLLKGVKSTATPLPELVDLAIQSCPIDTRRALYGNVVLSSGTTMFPNFARRLERDLKELANNRLKACQSTSSMQVNVVSQTCQSHAAWLGGSIVASGPRFHKQLITREQYEEEGPRVALRCPEIYAAEDFL